MSCVRDKMEYSVGARWTKRIITIVVVLGILMGVTAFFHVWPFSVAAGVVTAVTDPAKIIADYQWFYDEKAAIDAQRANLESAGPTEKDGMRMVLNNAIAEYNSRSRQITRNLWKASDLPYAIPMEGK